MILKHELQSNLKSFLIWTIAIAGFDFVMLLMYPSLQETMQEITSSYEKLGAFGQAFGMDRMSLGEPIGYYGTYIGMMIALCGAIYAAILGSGILAKEEGGHTAEYLYTLPYSRIHIVIHKILAVVLLLTAFEAVNLLFGILGLKVIDAEYSLQKILLFHFAQTFLHLEIASIGILVSACTRKVNLGIGLGIALILYFMDMMARVLEQLKGFQYITPYYYANAAEIFPNGKIDPILMIVGIGITIVCLMTSGIIYQRRDLYA